MRDRTKELGNNAEASDEDEEGKALMIKPGTSSAKDERENEAFLKKADGIREGMDSLRRMVAELENKQKTVLFMPLPEESMKKEFQTLQDGIITLAGQIQTKLKSIKLKKGEEDGNNIPINIRIQRTQHGVLSKEFVELMGRYNTIQAQYRDRYVERIRRQLKITGSNVTEPEMYVMVESGQTDVFTQNILIDAYAASQPLNEIESRHDEIMKLERNIGDLHEVFQYLAIEVDAQGETVNRIEEHVGQGTDYVEKAKDNMEKAAIRKKKGRKKKLWIAICLAILILILVISLAIVFGS